MATPIGSFVSTASSLVICYIRPFARLRIVLTTSVLLNVLCVSLGRAEKPEEFMVVVTFNTGDLKRGDEMVEVLKSHLFDLPVVVKKNVLGLSEDTDSTPVVSETARAKTPPDVFSEVLIDETGLTVSILESSSDALASTVQPDKMNSWSAQCDAAAVVVRSALISRLEAIETGRSNEEVALAQQEEEPPPKDVPPEKKAPVHAPREKQLPIHLWMGYSLSLVDLREVPAHMIGVGGGVLFRGIVGPCLSSGISWFNAGRSVDENVILLRVPTRLGVLLFFNPATKRIFFGTSCGFNLTLSMFNRYPSKNQVSDTGAVMPGAYMSFYTGVALSRVISLRMAIGADVFFRKYTYLWEERSLFQSSVFQPYLTVALLWNRNGSK